MRKIIALVVVALIAFYVAWPAWSGYRIANALREQDKDALAGKVDFPAVREGLKPVVAAEIARRLEERLKQEAGPLGSLIVGQIKPEQLTGIAEAAIDAVITPDNVIRIAHQGGTLREAMERVIGEQIGRAGSRPQGTPGDQGAIRLPGGLNLPGRQPGSSPPAQPAPAPEPARPAGAAKPSFGLANIKRFAVEGPLSFSVAVARNAAATEPDLTAGMAFTGGDWKVVRIVPRL